LKMPRNETRNVYQLEADADHKALRMIVGDLSEFVGRFDGTLMKQRWTNVTLGWDPEDAGPKGDFPWLLDVPVFSSRAMRALRDLLEGHGEIIPMTIEGEEYFLFNVTKVIDALDEVNSEVIKYFESPKIMRIPRYIFSAEKLSGVMIFKIPNFYRVFVTDPFIERVKSAGLKGFWFPRLWSTDKTAAIDQVF
jgi:hypothetical protein